ncbi:dwnn-domain-containing protein [Malassezia pachydermatis]|uniref:Dwnn-domain-containing protein n=1 Tax=Malassezia pachydermatis TaxID=77020 RepID=A0A0N0RSR4_9BASI|nr:dwnn-domain-containing protein [Malassezia pachydermatis]KOS16422.1 dwnn-domain-containing protein [Malassezia pachydermatis]
MATSAVYYKFRSQREPQKLTFDGTGISVWELKREIILQNKLGKGTDFDLAVYDADTDEEYKDDNYTIPRSSHVTVRRLPPSKPGRGTAQLYVADLQAPAGGTSVPETPAAPTPAHSMYRGPMSKRFDGKDGPHPGTPTSSAASVKPSAALDSHQDEASRIAAMFQATTEQWEETQERMSHATYRERTGMPRRGPPPGRGGAPPPPIDRPPPPPGFICYRCGQKGHWIQDCPTNNNPEYDNRRFKRTTGIPKSMLKTVEQSTAENMTGVMVTPDGSYVIATPDSGSWQRSRARSRPLSKTDVYKTVPSDPSLACPLCSKLLREAVKTSCCHTTFCEECIQTHLFEHDFVCPECEKRIPDLEMLKIDDVKRKQVREYVDKTIAQSEEAFEQGTGVDEEAAHQAAVSEFAATGASASTTAAPAPPVPEPVPKSEPSTTAAAAPATSLNDPTTTTTTTTTAPPPPPADGPTFNPQMVQQLVAMLQNPQLPMPMRMQLQMQLQFQQMLFFQTGLG